MLNIKQVDFLSWRQSSRKISSLFDRFLTWFYNFVVKIVVTLLIIWWKFTYAPEQLNKCLTVLWQLNYRQVSLGNLLRNQYIFDFLQNHLRIYETHNHICVSDFEENRRYIDHVVSYPNSSFVQSELLEHHTVLSSTLTND